MSDDRYKAPSSDVSVPDDRPPRPLFGIGLALLFDIVGSSVIGTVGTVAYGTFLTSKGARVDEVARVAERLSEPTGVGLVAQAFGIVTSALAGYLCVRWSRGKTLREPAILAVLELLLGAGLSLQRLSMPTHLLSLALGAIAVLAGGYLATRRTSGSAPT